MNTTESKNSYSGKICRVYDDILGPVYFRPNALELVKRILPDHPKNILEVACGTGIVTEVLNETFGIEAQIVASDISDDMLLIAKEKLEGEKNVTFVQADA